MPASNRDPRGSVWVKREEGSCAQGHPSLHSTSRPRAQRSSTGRKGGSRSGFQKLLPSARPALQPSGPVLLPLSPGPHPPLCTRLLPQLCAHPESRSWPLAGRTWAPGCLLPPPPSGSAGPGISGKINSGGEQLPWFPGGFVLWRAVRGRWRGVRCRLSGSSSDVKRRMKILLSEPGSRGPGCWGGGRGCSAGSGGSGGSGALGSDWPWAGRGCPAGCRCCWPRWRGPAPPSRSPCSCRPGPARCPSAAAARSCSRWGR